MVEFKSARLTSLMQGWTNSYNFAVGPFQFIQKLHG